MEMLESVAPELEVWV
jgi:hypothetical protein